ncbi:MAG TPA: response regulator [Terriglobales bacterium]|nr:response regulator [Terriglobales bacterium]
MEVGGKGGRVDLSGLSILVIDDDADARELFSLMLECCGAVVRVAGSAREAVVACDEARPDVIVTDLAMPDHDGFAFLRALRTRSECAGVPAIAVTGYQTYRAQAYNAGFNDVLVKPVLPAELCERVAYHAFS